MSDKIKIILVDDEVLFRKGISFILQRDGRFEIIAEASNGQELIDVLESGINPQIILMDLKMPLLNGVETTKIVNERFKECRVIALTSYNTPAFIANMIQIGASSYLVKSSSPEEVVTTIAEVADKGFYYNEHVMKVIHANIIQNKGEQIKSVFDVNHLTPREKEVLELICKQYSTNEIADKLCVSPRTIDGYRNQLLEKSGAKNMAGLVVFAIQNNFVDLDKISL